LRSVGHATTIELMIMTLATDDPFQKASQTECAGLIFDAKTSAPYDQLNRESTLGADAVVWTDQGGRSLYFCKVPLNS